MKWKKMCYIGSYEGIQPTRALKGGKENTWLFVTSQWHSGTSAFQKDLFHH